MYPRSRRPTPRTRRMNIRCSYTNCKNPATEFFKFLNKNAGPNSYFIACSECCRQIVKNGLKGYKRITQDKYITSRIADSETCHIQPCNNKISHFFIETRTLWPEYRNYVLLCHTHRHVYSRSDMSKYEKISQDEYTAFRIMES
jgi:hypothetical protein